MYWYCIELIAGKIDKENITFELEHDARIIARNTGSTPQKVEEMMRYFVKEGLFESANGVVTCLKLAKRLTQSMTSNPQMRAIIDNFKNHDDIMTESQIVMQDNITLDNIKEDINTPVQPEVKPSKYKFDSYQMEFAEWMYSQLLILNPNFKKPNLESWANTLRLMLDVDKRDSVEIGNVFAWANKDEFWSSNILSPVALRKQFDKLVVKMKQPVRGQKVSSTDGGNWAEKYKDTF